MAALQWAVVEADLDPVRGSEQRGQRPVLIVSDEEFNQAMPNVTVLPLTSTQRRLYPSEVLLPSGQAGLPRASIVMAHRCWEALARSCSLRSFAILGFFLICVTIVPACRHVGDIWRWRVCHGDDHEGERSGRDAPACPAGRGRHRGFAGAPT
ncbi:MAG: type II toxin-antitoxin system PemK/MazF family toxin [Chloroflexi bacterium]|nr:type II toxin-antitoxin system PemK/MazF family toxin [Chloroflexota bacterium]